MIASILKLTIGQINGLSSFIEKTDDKREYRRAVAVFQKADGKTYDYKAREHRVHIRTAKKWIHDYIKKGIEGLKIRENHGGRKPKITDEDREIILSALFNDPHLFGYLRNTWSLRSLAKCLTNELGIPISFKHLQRITKDLGIRCKRPKLELLHGKDYEEGKRRVEDANASYHLSMTLRKYINTQKDWLTVIHLPKKAPYLNPNERKVNQRIKSDVCANRFYEHIEDQKAAISEYLDKRFGRWR